MLPGGGPGGGRRRINQTQTPFPPSLPPHHPQQQSLNTINMLLSPPHTTPFSDHHHHPQPPPPASASISSGGRGHDEAEFPKVDERYPQWEIQETKDFIRLRAQLQGDASASQRNQGFWELLSNRMREKGYYRNADHCKAKWQNLINKYKENKEMEGTHADFSNQFPYFEELNEFFSMQEKQMFLNSEPGSSKLGKRERTTGSAQSSEEIYDGLKKIESDEDWIVKGPTVKKKKAKKEKSSDQPNIPANTNTTNVLNGLVETLQGFFQQQQKIDMLWMESMERHAQERALSEQEWRKSMEKLERERLMMENARKEREEQRRSREETRAERRDALLTALLNKLVHD